MTRSLLGRAGVVAAVAAAAVFAIAGPASAHVTVNPGTATQGDYTKVSFRVPTESDTASTTKLEVNLPTDTPIASVSIKPLPGWTAKTTTTKLATPIKSDDGEITSAITKIDWTASPGSEIKPGYFQEFDVSLGPLPKTNQVVFKSLQTYSDGTVIRWIDEPAAGGSEPEHPAPVLKLTAPAAAAAATSGPTVAVAATGNDASSSGNGNGGMAWGIAGLAAGVVAIVLGLLAYRRAGQKRA
jgi:periplasmic copper chaperone A